MLGASLAVWLASCPEGMVANRDTFNQCCWPGQGYSRTRSVCVGEPTCPRWLVARGEQCESNCSDGRVSTSKTGGLCCWPGQSAVKGRCVGSPWCPAGLASVGSECLPECEAGKARGPDTATHCCWPEQAWSRLQDRCVGEPRCPDGYELAEQACRPVTVATGSSSRVEETVVLKTSVGDAVQTDTQKTLPATISQPQVVELPPTIELASGLSPSATSPPGTPVTPQPGPLSAVDQALRDLGPETPIKVTAPTRRKSPKGARPE